MKRQLLVQAKGDGPRARAVSARVWEKLKEIDRNFGDSLAEKFAEEMRTARYRDWAAAK